MQHGFKSLINRFRPKNQTNFIGAESFSTWNPYSLFRHLHSDAYASAYPSIRAIANEYMTIQPYAIDGNGKPQQDNPVINALYHPNQLDSSVSFAEKIAVSTLALRKTYLLVWRKEGNSAQPGGDFTTDIIAGFTFLEFPSVTRRDKKSYYSIGSQEFTEDEVVVLPGGVDPYDLYAGYSPSEAARRWAKLDDYIADYQAGFFENGAVPAGQFIITAATKTEFNDIVDVMQERHRGARKNNNVTYTHRPVDPTSGKPVDAQITWVPFSQTNKDIDFKNLFDQVNNRIDTAYGVPAIVKGIDDAATYANAQVAERGFAKRAVYPLALRNYTQLTHELNRITGGLGVAITFKYEIPTVADEEKVEAETKSLNAATIVSLTEAGYSLDSVVEALELPNNYKLLKQGSGAATIDNDKPDVDEGDEVEESPDPTKIDGVTPVNKNKKSKIVPKDQLSKSDVDTYEEQLKGVIRDDMSSQIEDAIKALDAQSATNDDDDKADEFTDAMMIVIIAAMIVAGDIQYSEGQQLLTEAGVSIDDTSSFSLTDAQQDDYREYLENVAKSYRDDTAESIRNVLARGHDEGWNRNELESNLRNVMNTDDYRVTRLSTSEINRTQQTGSLHAMEQLTDETEVKLEKVWNTSGDPCPICQALEGKVVGLEETFLSKGESIETTDDKTFVNDFVDMDTSQAHPNCHCFLTYKVVK